MTRKTRDQVCLEVAILFSARGTCSRAQVGVVIAREGRILVTGYNGAPAGMPHCEHPPDEATDDPTAVGCEISTHAEVNAIAWAARHGIRIEGADLFTTVSPCAACARVIINAGLTRVVCWHYYRNMTGVELLQQAGVEVQLLP